MDVKTLDYFIALEEFGHYSSAAKHAFISAQGLSSSIKRLEGELGVPLFNTVDGTVTLTEYGKMFSRYAHETSHSTKEIVAAINELRKRRESDIALVSSVGLIDCYPIDFLDRFNEENDCNACVTKTRALPDTECEESLVNSWCDFALINEPIDHERFASVPLFRDCMFAWVPVENDLSSRTSLTCADLSGQHLTELSLDYVQSKNTERLLRKRAHGYDILHVNEMIQILGHAIRDKRIGLTVRLHAETVNDERVRAIPVVDDTWAFSLCWSAGRFLSKADMALIDWFRGSPVSNVSHS